MEYDNIFFQLKLKFHAADVRRNVVVEGEQHQFQYKKTKYHHCKTIAFI